MALKFEIKCYGKKITKEKTFNKACLENCNINHNIFR